MSEHLWWLVYPGIWLQNTFNQLLYVEWYYLFRYPLPVREIRSWCKKCPGQRMNSVRSSLSSLSSWSPWSPSWVVSVLIAPNSPDVASQVKVPAEFREPAIVSPVLSSWGPGDPIGGAVEEHKQLPHVLLFSLWKALQLYQNRYLGIPGCAVVTGITLSARRTILSHNVPNNLGCGDGRIMKS